MRVATISILRTKRVSVEVSRFTLILGITLGSRGPLSGQPLRAMFQEKAAMDRLEQPSMSCHRGSETSASGTSIRIDFKGSLAEGAVVLRVEHRRRHAEPEVVFVDVRAPHHELYVSCGTDAAIRVELSGSWRPDTLSVVHSDVDLLWLTAGSSHVSLSSANRRVLKERVDGLTCSITRKEGRQYRVACNP